MTTLLTDTARDLTTQLDEGLRREELRRQKGEKQLTRRIAWNADALAGITLSIWEWVRETLEEKGFEARELAGYCRLLLEGIDLGLSGYEKLLAMAKEDSLTPEAAGLRGLEAKLPDLREARPKVAEMLDLATRQPRPVDEARLAESGAALQRGEFVNIDEEYLARLRAGEDF
jgi:hypothetical protein